MVESKEIFHGVHELFRSKQDKENEKKRLEKLRAQEPILIQELTKIDDKWKKDHVKKPIDYESLFDESLGLKYKEYDNTPIEDIEKRTKHKYDNLYKNDIRDIKRRYANKYVDTNKALDDIYSNEDDDLRMLSEKYSKRVRNERNKNIDKGIAKSSIARLVEEDMKNDAYKDIAKVKDETADKVKEHEAKLAKLESERDDALAKLDVKKAHDIEREIYDINKMIAKSNDKVTEYNNDVDERERAYSMKREDAIDVMKKRAHDKERSDLIYEKYHGYKPEKASNYKGRLMMALSLYNQMPRDIAIESIAKNSRLKELLGIYYDELLAKQKARGRYS